jgi:hypothetical protein
MSDSRKLTDLSRQELYDLIWSSPVAKVAADFGVTETVVKNHCNNRKVPRPTRRYWTKLAAGIKPRKKPLPPTPQEVFEIEAQRRVPKALALPEPGARLHPLATELLTALNKTKPGDQKLVHLKEPVFPEVTVSKPLVERTAQAFHVILRSLEPLGIEFKKYQGTFDPGFFKRGNDRLFFFIDETLVDHARIERKCSYWNWATGGTPSGHLAFTYNPSRWGQNEERAFEETNRHKLDQVLSEVVVAIRQHFLNRQRERIQQAIDRKKWQEEYEKRHREWLAEEVIRIQKEKEQAHVNAIKSVIGARKGDLIKAAEWWSRSCKIADFIEECDRRWKCPTGELNSEQAAWLAWAREIANSISPFTACYPEPAKHGAFDASTIPFGGPYPSAKNFPQPS